VSGAIVPASGIYSEVVESMLALPVEQREKEIDEYITWVEDKLLDLDQARFAYSHQILDGIYIRTMLVPAGITLTGAIHKKACFTILWSGKLSVLTTKGAALLEGPLFFPAEAGVRRLGYCHTDVLCSTIHAVSSTNLDEIEAELFDFANPEV
jgi:hypothetical protein